MKRGFEKITKKQFEKDFLGKVDCTINDVLLPERKTISSAGYDFSAPFDFILEPGEIIKIPTGIKVYMLEDEMLSLYVRSSAGFKYNVRLCNQVGIVDSDYYNNDVNEGHIWLAFKNEGFISWEIKKGEGIAQGVFSKFLKVDFENDVLEKRNGGFGSTNEKVSYEK